MNISDAELLANVPLLRLRYANEQIFAEEHIVELYQLEWFWSCIIAICKSRASKLHLVCSRYF